MPIMDLQGWPLKTLPIAKRRGIAQAHDSMLQGSPIDKKPAHCAGFCLPNAISLREGAA